jgi:O-antigen ligase/tetratricopeptide (TPR) repeat protein
MPGRPQPFVGRVLDVAIEGLVLLLVSLSPWAFGCVHPGFELLLKSGVALLLLLWAAKFVFAGFEPLDYCPLALCMAGLMLFGVGQIVPLPQSVLAWVSPATSAWYDSLLPGSPEELADGTPAAESTKSGATISFDPAATREEVVRLLAFLAIFLVVRQNLASPACLRRLCLIGAVNGTLLTLFALVQFWTAKGGTIYWTFPSQGWTYGPFINHDHAACYLNLCFGLALGLFLARSRRAEASAGRNWWLDAGVLWLALPPTILLVGVAFSLSRGGLIAFFGAAGLCLALRFAFGSKGRMTGSLLVMIGLAFGLLTWFGIGPMMDRLSVALEHGEPGRLRAWSRVLPLAVEFPLWGTGYGTFGSVELTRRDDAIDAGFAFQHAHNEYVEALVEGGIPRLLLTLAAIGLVVRAALRTLRRESDTSIADLTLGGLFAVLALVLQSFVEFAVHIPAIALLATVIAAHLSGIEAATRPVSNRDVGTENAAAPVASILADGPMRFVAALVALGLAFVLFADGWKEYRIDRLRSSSRYAGLGVPERILRLEAAARLAPENASIHLELAEAHLQAVEERKRQIVRQLLVREAAEAVAGFAPSVGAGQAVHPILTQLAGSVVAAQGREQRLESQAEGYAAHVSSALREFVRARNANPLLSAPQLHLATHSHELARADSSLAYLDRAKWTAPGDPRLWYLCGLRELALLQPERACADWRRSLALSPAHLKEILEISKPLFAPEVIRTRILADDPDQLLAAALHLFPEPDEGNDGNERAAERRRFLEQALALMERQPAPRTAEALHVKAVTLAALNQPDRSLTAYRLALGQEPQRIEWRWEFAQLLHKRGLLAEARLELRTILQTQSGHVPARELWRTVEREIAEKR